MNAAQSRRTLRAAFCVALTVLMLTAVGGTATAAPGARSASRASPIVKVEAGS